MKIIKLTQGFETIVDDKHYDELSKYNWIANHNKSRQSMPRAIRVYKTQDGKQKDVKMHRFIMELEGHNIKGLTIDHKNGNKLDNRVENLRVATTGQNNRNVIKRGNNTSGYKGVHWDKKSQKWISRIRIGGGQRLTLGKFSNKEDAAKAYNEAALKYHGEFANLNKVK